MPPVARAHPAVGARRPAVVLAVLALAGGAGAPGPAAASEACASLSSRRLEVCTAYVVNSTLLARVPFYIASGIENRAIVRLARYRLESRYEGAARASIEAQVAAWPPGDVDVQVPSVAIERVSVGRRRLRATLRTRETWLVSKRDPATGALTPVFQETGQAHDVVMASVRGLLLRKWVVVSISNAAP
jgi:hypothetical protein